MENEQETPATWQKLVAALPDARDPDVARVRALVEARMLGDPLAPTRIGRYVLLERIASGGMGVVFAAYDGELERRIALKLLRSDHVDGGHRRRIVREARAMAKLSHPNVASVYEIGEHEGRTFIAMELVIGQTLREWQLARKPRIRDTLAMHVQAGRGLAAAHAAGLVHRDFKPDNVLVGSDGRARVADFGLAFAHTIHLDERSSTELPPAAVRVATSGATDGLAGSPAYMAPEQVVGGDVDARADQFSFCVSLWEALYGARPYIGGDIAALRAAIATTTLTPPPRTGVPSRVQRILLRGLRAERDDRYPSMDALLADLEREHSAWRLRMAGGVAVAGVMGGVIWALVRSPDAATTCEQEASLAEVWNPDRAASLRAAFLASDRPYAPASAETFIAGADEWVGRWTETYQAACRAVHVEHSRSFAQLEAQVACLGRARQSLSALVEVVEAADPATIERAAQTIDGLPAVDRCTDVRRVERDIVVAPEDRASTDTVLAEIARMDELRAVAHYDEALAVGEAAIPAAAALGYPHIDARLHYALAQVHGTRVAHDLAVAEAERALALAIRGEDDELATRITSELAWTEGYRRGRREVAAAWVAQAESWLDRVGRPPDLEIEFLVGRGFVLRTADRLEEALADFEQALELQQVHAADNESERARILAAIGNTQRMLGRFEQARDTMEDVVASQLELLGPDHPHVANELNTLGSVHMTLGESEEAEAMFERAIAIYERSLGPGAPRLILARSNLGSVYVETGRIERALAVYESVVTDIDAVPPGSGDVSRPLGNISMVLLDAGQIDRAGEMVERALAAAKAFAGEDSADYAEQLMSSVSVAWAREDWAQALALAERALAIFEAKLGPDHLQSAFARMQSSYALLKLGRAEEALAAATRARTALTVVLGADHPHVASAVTAERDARAAISAR